MQPRRLLVLLIAYCLASPVAAGEPQPVAPVAVPVSPAPVAPQVTPGAADAKKPASRLRPRRHKGLGSAGSGPSRGQRTPLQAETQPVAPVQAQPGRIGQPVAPVGVRPGTPKPSAAPVATQPGRAETSGVPFVQSIEPASGPAGTLVVIRGRAFSGAGQPGAVYFGSVRVRPHFWSHGEVRVHVPDDAPLGSGLRLTARTPQPHSDPQPRTVRAAAGARFRVTAPVQQASLAARGGFLEPPGATAMRDLMRLELESIDRPSVGHAQRGRVSIENLGDRAVQVKLMTHLGNRDAAVALGAHHLGAGERKSVEVRFPRAEIADLRCAQECVVTSGAYLVDAVGDRPANAKPIEHTAPVRAFHGVSRITLESVAIHDTCEGDNDDEGEFSIEFSVWDDERRSHRYRRFLERDLVAGQTVQVGWTMNLQVARALDPGQLRVYVIAHEDDFWEHWDRSGFRFTLTRDAVLEGGRFELRGDGMHDCPLGAMTAVLRVEPIDPWNPAEHGAGR
ncbi:MAG: IPT/TIG domain-containing protein [Myxococcota bacterium]|nr:IPT/TIG domain-containing protein [Myxococcota bacterium]